MFQNASFFLGNRLVWAPVCLKAAPGPSEKGIYCLTETQTLVCRSLLHLADLNICLSGLFKGFEQCYQCNPRFYYTIIHHTSVLYTVNYVTNEGGARGGTRHFHFLRYLSWHQCLDIVLAQLWREDSAQTGFYSHCVLKEIKRKKTKCPLAQSQRGERESSTSSSPWLRRHYSPVD